MKRLAVMLSTVLLCCAFAAQAQVQGFSGKYTSPETTDESPSMASLSGRLYIAWKGVDSPPHLNVMVSTNGGHSFGNKTTSGETSGSAPSLATHRGRLFIAWRGLPNNQLNVAEVTVDASGSPGALVRKYTSAETSTSGPVLMSTGNDLFITWRGVGNNQLNVARVDVR